MKYFLDTEFIEHFKKPIKWLPTFGNFNKPFHTIELISIGIISMDGRAYYAISNEYNYNDADDWVKENVIIPMYTQEISGDRRNHIDAEHFHKCIPNGKTNKQIAMEVAEFCKPNEIDNIDPNIEFYGYYADYDWVLFCSLFGRMIDLPKGFPMYCKDLKQYFDDIQYTQNYDLKKQPNYPKQQNEHNALADAKWNVN